jgi:hypothetical protein
MAKIKTRKPADDPAINAVLRKLARRYGANNLRRWHRAPQKGRADGLPVHGDADRLGACRAKVITTANLNQNACQDDGQRQS